MERTFGWRHFRVLQKRGQGKEAFVLMQATCDETAQFWVRCGRRARAALHCAAPLRRGRARCGTGTRRGM